MASSGGATNQAACRLIRKSVSNRVRSTSGSQSPTWSSLGWYSAAAKYSPHPASTSSVCHRSANFVERKALQSAASLSSNFSSQDHPLTLHRKSYSTSSQLLSPTDCKQQLSLSPPPPTTTTTTTTTSCKVFSKQSSPDQDHDKSNNDIFLKPLGGIPATMAVLPMVDVAVVLSEHEEEDLHLSFRWHGRKLEMKRRKTEALEVCLKRVILSFRKNTNKRDDSQAKRRKQQEAAAASDETSAAPCPPSPASPVLDNPSDIQFLSVDGSVLNGDGRTPLIEVLNATDRINFGGVILKLLHNPPRVSRIYVAERAVEGFPLVVGLASANPLPTGSPPFQIEWRSRRWTAQTAAAPITASAKKGGSGNNDGVHQGGSLMQGGAGVDADLSTDPPLAVGPVYVPRPEDVGYQLEIRASYTLTPQLCTYVLTSPVLPLGPPNWRTQRLAAFRPHHNNRTNILNTVDDNFENNRSDRESSTDEAVLRIGTFNILANIFATTDRAKEILYPYCPVTLLTMKHRIGSICFELDSLALDFVGIQECETRTFTRFLVPFLQTHHMKGRQMLKAGRRPKEGCAVFYNTEKFELLECDDFILRDAFMESPAFASLRNEIQLIWPTFLESVISHMSAVAQISVLKLREPTIDNPMTAANSSSPNDAINSYTINGGVKSKTSNPKIIIVSNTHLFFHPLANHIRALQVLTLIHRVSLLYEKYATAQRSPDCYNNNLNHPTPQVSAVLLGDFNALPDSAAYALVTEGHVSRSHPSWADGSVFYWESPELVESALESATTDDDDEELEGMEIGAENGSQAGLGKSEVVLTASVSDDIGSRNNGMQVMPAGVRTACQGGFESSDGNQSYSNNSGGTSIYEAQSNLGVERVGAANCQGDLKGLDIRLSDFVANSDLSCFMSVYESQPNEFTTYINGFQGTLDHIFVSKPSGRTSEQMKPRRLLAPISSSDLVVEGGLPSAVYPSDHIAIAAELPLSAFCGQ